MTPIQQIAFNDLMNRIEYDTPISVTKEQYEYLMEKYGQIIAGRVDEKGAHWIKVWIMSFKMEIAMYLSTFSTE